MGDRCTPRTLFFDLDDTLVSFSTGQGDLWSRVVHKHRAALRGVDVEAWVRVIDELVSPRYWGDPMRSASGRLDLVRARREVLYWADYCFFGGVDLAEIEGSYATGQTSRFSPRLPDAVLCRIADDYTYSKEDAVAPLEDAVDAVRTLRSWGYRTALITNGGSEFQRRKIARYELEPLFDAIVVEGEWGMGKPHASVFERALALTQSSAAQSWMIGDNFEADILGASQLGIGGVWVHHGRLVPPAAVYPLHCIGHVRELLPLLRKGES